MTVVVEQELTEQLRERLDRQAAALATRGARSVSLVGSRAPGDSRSTSDVDLRPDLAPDATFDLVDPVTLKDHLVSALGQKVDVLLEGGLRPYVAAAVERDAHRLI